MYELWFESNRAVGDGYSVRPKIDTVNVANVKDACERLEIVACWGNVLAMIGEFGPQLFLPEPQCLFMPRERLEYGDELVESLRAGKRFEFVSDLFDAHFRIVDCLCQITAAITEPEQLTQRKSKRLFEGFVFIAWLSASSNKFQEYLVK